MNVTEGTSEAGVSREEERPKTFDEYLNEAERLYKKCKPLIESPVKIREGLAPNDIQVTERDNDKTIVRKMNLMLDLEKTFQEAMGIRQAKENIDSALKLGKTKKAKQLESDIEASFKYVMGPIFQCQKALASSQKWLLTRSLWERSDAAPAIAANTSRSRVIPLKDRLDKLKKKFPSPAQCFSEAIKETINYEKQFPNDDSSAGSRVKLKQLRQSGQDAAFNELAAEQRGWMKEVDAKQDCLVALLYSADRELAIQFSDEEVLTYIEVLDKTVKSTRDVAEYVELLVDPQTTPLNPAQTEAARYKRNLEICLPTLTVFQAALAFWQSTKLVKPIDPLTANDDVKTNILRIDAATRKLTDGLINCYPDIIPNEHRTTPSGSERERRLTFLAKGYEFIACECHRLTGDLSKRSSEGLLTLGETLSGVGESLSKELKSKGVQVVFAESEIEEFIDRLFEAENIGLDEEDIEEKALGDERSAEELGEDEVGSLDESVDSQKRGAAHVVTTDQSGQETASRSPALSAKDERVTARLVQEVDSHQKEKARRLKAIEKDKRQLEKVEQKLDVGLEKLERIKQALKTDAPIQYLTYDLKNAPKMTVKHARRAQVKASNIAAKLEAFEEFSLSKGAVSEEAHRNEISEYAAKAVEYERLEKQCRSDGEELQIAGIKASLAIEAVRKSNAAKRLLAELVDAEKDPASLRVTACRALPYCPKAKNEFGILEETKDGQPLYDHVVEFRVALESVPEFVVHFHFRHVLETAKTPDYYAEKMEVHDWNVQASQKQEGEEKRRTRQLEGGQKVLMALKAGWKKSLEINRGKTQGAPSASATQTTVASAAPSGKKKNKGKARRG
jgi:hypothetical protein